MFLIFDAEHRFFNSKKFQINESGLPYLVSLTDVYIHNVWLSDHSVCLSMYLLFVQNRISKNIVYALELHGNRAKKQIALWCLILNTLLSSKILVRYMLPKFAVILTYL